MLESNAHIEIINKTCTCSDANLITVLLPGTINLTQLEFRILTLGPITLKRELLSNLYMKISPHHLPVNTVSNRRFKNHHIVQEHLSNLSLLTVELFSHMIKPVSEKVGLSWKLQALLVSFCQLSLTNSSETRQQEAKKASVFCYHFGNGR